MPLLPEYPVELFIRAGACEFERLISLPYVPVAGMMLHEGPAHRGRSYRVAEVTWLCDEGRFLCELEDDETDPEEFEHGVVEDYERRGWCEVTCVKLRVVGWPWQSSTA